MTSAIRRVCCRCRTDLRRLTKGATSLITQLVRPCLRHFPATAWFSPSRTRRLRELLQRIQNHRKSHRLPAESSAARRLLSRPFRKRLQKNLLLTRFRRLLWSRRTCPQPRRQTTPPSRLARRQASPPRTVFRRGEQSGRRRSRGARATSSSTPTSALVVQVTAGAGHAIL